MKGEARGRVTVWKNLRLASRTMK
ncbi:hypothetical protein RDI58_017704 [Solanum bulbocastanum]|uniref:Uncharacterized protein n=1 Tax=Solanum bulbocastanum TaxID=147425 RepID=A0AAN8TA01_SOLBU